jgi:hypothetical protein
VTGVLTAGLLLALASAAALNWGFFTQQGAAAALPALSVRRPFRSLRTLFCSPRWTLGFLTGVGGWALYVAALRLAPLSLVQAFSAGGIGLLALLVWRTADTAPSGRAMVGVGVAVGGLVLLGLSLVGGGAGVSQVLWIALAAWLSASVVAALLAVAPGLGGLSPGAGFGIAAGVLYAAGDVATKAAVGSAARLTLVPAVLALHGLAFVALQLGFQRGGALTTAGVATLFTNALPIVAGTTIFHEPLPSGLAGAARLVAFAAVVLGAVALAASAESSSNASIVKERRRVRLRLPDHETAARLVRRLHAADGEVRLAGSRDGEHRL